VLSSKPRSRRNRNLCRYENQPSLYGISKPSNIEKEQLKPLVTEFFQHYIKMKDILNELPRFSSDEAVGSVLSDRAKLNEKRARTRSDLYKALEEITFMRECTSSITKVWPKGKYLTEKMYQLLADGKNYILNLLKMDEFWNASNGLISNNDFQGMSGCLQTQTPDSRQAF
jgi:hypothetical protein